MSCIHDVVVPALSDSDSFLHAHTSIAMVRSLLWPHARHRRRLDATVLFFMSLYWNNIANDLHRVAGDDFAGLYVL